MKYKLVIFDVDGLMLDTESVWKEAWQTVGEKYGAKDLGSTTFMKCVGRNGQEVEPIIISDLSPYGDAQKIRDEVRAYGFKKLAQHIDVKEGLFELLDYLKTTDAIIAVATSTCREFTNERLTKTGLIDCFDYILCGDEVTKSKPNPEIYEKVVKHFHLLPQDAVVLEDSVAGVQAAYSAKIPCIMVPDLIPPTSLQEQQTIAIVKSLKEAMELLKTSE